MRLIAWAANAVGNIRLVGCKRCKTDICGSYVSALDCSVSGCGACQLKCGE